MEKYKTYLFTHPKKFKQPKYKVGDTVWIIEDEWQGGDEYIDKVKSATIVDFKPYWFEWPLIQFTVFGKRIKLIKTYTQYVSVTLKNDTLTRVSSTDGDIFLSEEEANEYFNNK